MTERSKQPLAGPNLWELAADEHTPINLEVRFRTGDGCFFPYAYLTYCRYDKGGTIEMHFSSWVLRVVGRNLGDFYRALSRHMVISVQEGERDENSPESAAYISELSVSESDE